MLENYSSHEHILASYIATALDDLDSLDFHLQNTRRYPESVQREIVEQVLSIPKHKIKKSRAALYTYLITKHGRNGNDGY